MRNFGLEASASGRTESPRPRATQDTKPAVEVDSSGAAEDPDEFKALELDWIERVAHARRSLERLIAEARDQEKTLGQLAGFGRVDRQAFLRSRGGDKIESLRESVPQIATELRAYATQYIGMRDSVSQQSRYFADRRILLIQKLLNQAASYTKQDIEPIPGIPVHNQEA